MPIDGYFDTPFAIDGDKTAVPDGVQPDGSVSYDQGYGPDYEQDPAVHPTTALNIERRKMNQIFYDVSLAIRNWQQNTIAPFITSAMNGGTPYSYSKGNLVLYSGTAYQSLQDANTDTPPTVKWQIFDLSLFLLKANNLSDVASAATSRNNLGLGSAAVQAIAFFLQTANNLSDLPSKPTARSNLGLGSIATLASTQSCKAWVRFNGSTSVIASSFNVSSITRHAAGDYTINFTSSVGSSTYSIVGTGCDDLAGTTGSVSVYPASIGGTDPTTTAVRIVDTAGGIGIDEPIISVDIFGV